MSFRERFQRLCEEQLDQAAFPEKRAAIPATLERIKRALMAGLQRDFPDVLVTPVYRRSRLLILGDKAHSPILDTHYVEFETSSAGELIYLRDGTL